MSLYFVIRIFKRIEHFLKVYYFLQSTNISYDGCYISGFVPIVRQNFILYTLARKSVNATYIKDLVHWVFPCLILNIFLSNPFQVLQYVVTKHLMKEM